MTEAKRVNEYDRIDHPSLGPQTALAVKLCHVHGITLAFPNSRRRAIGAAV